MVFCCIYCATLILVFCFIRKSDSQVVSWCAYVCYHAGSSGTGSSGSSDIVIDATIGGNNLPDIGNFDLACHLDTDSIVFSILKIHTRPTELINICACIGSQRERSIS